MTEDYLFMGLLIAIPFAILGFIWWLRREPMSTKAEMKNIGLYTQNKEEAATEKERLQRGSALANKKTIKTIKSLARERYRTFPQHFQRLCLALGSPRLYFKTYYVARFTYRWNRDMVENNPNPWPMRFAVLIGIIVLYGVFLQLGNGDQGITTYY